MDSFRISRNIFAKDSGSNYEINQQVSSRAQVVELLKSKGMDMNNNRFLILQGEVEQISLMKPMTGKKEDPGLLEYLEDIIGSHAYVEQIHQLEKDYAEAKREKENRLLLVHDVRKELDSMESNKQKAIQFMEAEHRGLCLNHIFHNLKIFESRDKETTIQAKISHLEQERDQMRTDLRKMMETYQGEFKQLKELEAQMNALNQEKEGVKQKMDNDTKHDHAIMLKIKSLITSISESNSMIEKNKADIEKRSQEIAKMREDLPHKEAHLEKIHGELQQHSGSLTAMMAKIQPEVKKFNEKLQELKEKITPVERETSTYESQKRTLAKKLEDLMGKESKMLEDREKLAYQLQNSTSEIDKLKSKKDQMQQETKIREDRLLLCKQGLEQIEETNRKLGEELRLVENKLHEVNTHKEQAMSQNHVLTYLMGNQDLKPFGKIYGRIGDLASIKEEYDIAISALGNQFNNILVESNTTAKECINLLKKDKVGAAHFTALNKQMDKKQYMNKPFTAPPDSKRLFDLVETNSEEVRLVYYNILQDTLVCRDIETAQRIAYGGNQENRRYRVVTLEGFIINPDGSMSGGGRPKRGMVGSKIKQGGHHSSDDMQLPKENLQELLKQKENLRNSIETLTKEYHTLKQECSKLDGELRRAPQMLRSVEQEILHETKDNNQLSARLNAITSELESGNISEEKKRIDKDMKFIEQKIKQSQEALRELEQERALQQQKIDQVGGPELKMLKELQDETKKQCEKVEEETERMKAEIRKSEETKKNRLKEITEHEKKIAAYEKDHEILKKQKENGEQVYLEDLKRHSELDKEIHNLSTKLQELAESGKSWLENIQKVKIHLEEIRQSKEIEGKALEAVKTDFAKIKEDLDANRKKFLDFVSLFSIIEDLKKLDKRDPSDEVQDEDNDDDDDLENSNSKTQGNRRNKTQRSALKRKEVPPSGKKRKEAFDISSITPDRDISKEELEEVGLDIEKVRAEITMLKNLKMNLNTDTEVIQIFQDKLKEYFLKSSELSRVTEKEINLRSELTKLKDRRRLEFMAGFSFIANTLKNVYQTITQGGDADLEPIDNSDPFASGISFNVRPPQKSWKQMSKLSGGEKTLSSLSLIFALHYYKPTPIYFMDEIDAALDFRNVEIVAKFIKERTKDAQFIVISLRNHMFELASQLIGIYKTQDTTKTISIYPLPIIDAVNEELRREMTESRGSLGARLSRRSQGGAYSATQDLSAIKARQVTQNMRSRLSMPSQQAAVPQIPPSVQRDVSQDASEVIASKSSRQEGTSSLRTSSGQQGPMNSRRSEKFYD